ncbi:MAG: hypothetical protein HYR84_12860 [Planctomycetes bacterium]|nr:hypothetical protein [Planctomycetota bacterium]
MGLEITNPFNENDTADDKVSILDIKALDRSGRQNNIEIPMADFARLIAECRQRFACEPSWLWRWFGAKGRPTYDPRDTPDAALAAHYAILLDHGQVVWGALAQANSGMFSPGDMDLPAVTIYSPDPFYDSHPQDLSNIGYAAYVLKGSVPDDDDLKPLAARMTDEYDATPRGSIARRLTGGREVYSAATMFHRTRLPNGVLSARIFPMVIAPAHTDMNMILPLAYWAGELFAIWTRLDQQLANAPLMHDAEKIARNATKRPFVPGQRKSADGIPITVSDTAARAFRRAVASLNTHQAAYAAVGYHTSGPKSGDLYVDIAEKYDPSQEHCYESNGVRVLIRIDQEHRFQGALLDFSEMLGGFTVRFPE